MTPPYRLGLIYEHALGHITHAHYLKRAADLDPAIEYDIMRINPKIALALRWLPRAIHKNWNLIGSLAARHRILTAQYGGKLDLVYIHTQVMGFFTRGLARRLPVVLSMDATPINLDTFGHYFGHYKDDSRPMAWIKKTANRRMYQAAAKIITLNRWAAASLVKDYGVPEEKIEVIPPGVNVSMWDHHRKIKPPGAPVNILFVGGNFERKGGYVLLKAFSQLPPGLCRLDVVAEVFSEMLPAPPGVTYHGSLPNNSPELLRLYADADFFVLPTFADLNCLVIMEALAMRIPVITTSVGGLGEQVTDGVNGFIVNTGDVDTLARHMLTLATNPHLRHQMGDAGRRHVEQHFNAAKNYPRVLEVLKQAVDNFHHTQSARTTPTPAAPSPSRHRPQPRLPHQPVA